MKKIRVEPNPNGENVGKRWKASVTLPSWACKFPHPVQGQRTGSPPEPFVEGFGYTPELAIVNAYESLGRAVFDMPDDAPQKVEETSVDAS